MAAQGWVEDVSPMRCARRLALLALTFAVPARAATAAERHAVVDTVTIAVTKPTVVAYLVIPEGAVDSQPDVAVLADDWNVAMATLGDSLAAHGIGFALATESSLKVRTRGRRDVVIDLNAEPKAGYVFARPGTVPCVKRGPAEADEVLRVANALLGRRLPSQAARRTMCGVRSR